eukprot:29099-Pelagococcus_subviridis.AAC.6
MKGRGEQRKTLPHPDPGVVRAGGHDERILRGELRGSDLRRRTLHLVRRRVDVREVVYPQQFLAPAREELLAVLREAHGLDDVLMREAVQLVSRDRVPQTRGEVRARGRAVRRRRVQRRPPHAPLMPLERADPVSRLAVPKHRLAVFTARDQEHAVVRDVAVLQVHDRSRVPVAHERGRHRDR